MTRPIIKPIPTLPPLYGEFYRRYLPSAYDSSLSIYEQLTNILEYLNKMGKLTDELISQWNIICEWIMNEGLNDAVKKELEKMLEDGRLGDLINQLILKIRETYYEDIPGTTFKEKMEYVSKDGREKNILYIVSMPKYKTIEVADENICIDVSYVNIEGNNSTVIYTGCKKEGYFIRLMASKLLESKRYINDMTFIVAGGTKLEKIGLLFGRKDVCEVLGVGMEGLVLDGVTIEHFYPAEQFETNAYLIRHYDCKIRGGINMPVGQTNYGENIFYQNCVLFNTRGTLVTNANPNGDFRFNGCSFDYSDRIFTCLAGGIIADNCHFEFRTGGETPDLIYDYPAFKCDGSNSRIQILNSRIMGNTNFAGAVPGTPKRPYIFEVYSDNVVGSKRASIEIKDCSIWGLQTTTERLCGGNDTGKFIIKGSHSNSIWLMPLRTKDNNNARISVDLELDGCTVEIVDDTLNGKPIKAMEFTVTKIGAHAILTLPTDENVTWSIWGKGLPKDSYTTFYFSSEGIQNKPTANFNTPEWKESRSSTFYKPAMSHNKFTIDANRGLYNVGEKFRLYVDEIYTW